jgi:Uma2 family endonuclease
MAIRALISREEYLQTSFEGPEPDYVDGELVERPVPNFFHSHIQIRLADAFKPWEDQGQLYRASEIRLSVGPDRFRIADFAVFASKPNQAIPQEAPQVVVEIVSPDDRYEEIMSRLADYEAAGVDYIFVADPPLRKLSRYRHGDLFSVAAIELAVPPVVIPLDLLFGE